MMESNIVHTPAQQNIYLAYTSSVHLSALGSHATEVVGREGVEERERYTVQCCVVYGPLCVFVRVGEVIGS